MYNNNNNNNYYNKNQPIKPNHKIPTAQFQNLNSESNEHN